MRRKIAVFVLVASLLVCNRSFISEGAYYNMNNSLHVPTQITKIADEYFLVDCYHDQVLFHEDYYGPAEDWAVMASGLSKPHAIAGDGLAYLVVDTDNNRVINYIKSGDSFRQYQVFENIGNRPHYIVYDEQTGYFYAWSSMTGEMYLFKRQENSLEVILEKVMAIPELYGKYVRSFTIDGDVIYFPCTDAACIVVADKETLRVNAMYPVPPDIAGMVQILKIQNYFYLTISSNMEYDQQYASCVRARSLEDFGIGNYEDINDKFGSSGAPYYVSCFDDAYFTVVIRPENRDCGYKFRVIDDKMQDVEEIFY